KAEQKHEKSILCGKIDRFLSGEVSDLPFSMISSTQASSSSVDLTVLTHSGDTTVTLPLLPLDSSGKSEGAVATQEDTGHQRYSWWQDGSIIEESRIGNKRLMTEFTPLRSAVTPSRTASAKLASPSPLIKTVTPDTVEAKPPHE